MIDETIEAATIVARGWDGESTDDRDEVVGPMTEELRSRGFVDRCPAIIADAAAAAGVDLPSTPVPASPYVSVASTGPVLRATVPGGRLVIQFRVFCVDRRPVRYHRRPGRPSDVLDVEYVDDG